jgi:spore coat polysaccharide biosynthesis predicted glycosyltransferase SpsG
VIISSSSFDVDKAIRAWYGLMAYFLILDDLADIREDLLNGEENVLIDAGLDEAGAKKVAEMIDESIATMHLVNPVMANRIEHKKSLINLHEIIRSIRHSANG